MEGEAVRILVIVAAVLCMPALGFSATYYVPDHFPGIQDAISDAAVIHGDVIIVRDGVYHENLDFLGKYLTVKSEKGPVTTVIDGGMAGSVVKFVSGEIHAAVIEGFTLTHGSGEYIPGMGYCGGGIFCTNYSYPQIKNNIIVQNFVSGSGGGIIAIGDPLKKTSPRLLGNTISNNYSAFEGGGIWASFSDIDIQDNIIDNNIALNGAGGGICIKEKSFIVVMNCTLFNNTAFYGGAIYFYEGWNSAVIHNSLIFNNFALYNGGGVSISESVVHLNYTTLYGNRADACGGGLYFVGDAELVYIRDSIFWANIASQSYDQIGWSGSYPPSVKYCDVQGGYTGTGNIDQDPLFAAVPDGYHYLGQTAAGQPADSPCKDAGSDLASKLGMDMLWTRTDNVPDSGMVDMGYHYSSYPPVSRFLVDTLSISESTGGVANFRLLAGATQANKQYLIMGNVFGPCFPGIPLPGWAVLPMSWDPFTSMALGLVNTPIFQNFMGQLDANGEASATFDTLGPLPLGVAGIAMYFAYVTEGWNFVSNVTKIHIDP